jgi:hypothetical protein
MKRKSYILIIALVTFLAACESDPQNGQEVIDRSVKAYGGERIYRSDIEFDFRDKHYRAFFDQGVMSYERKFEDDSLGSVHDVLNNDGFTRSVNGQVVELDEEWTGKYSRSVNSVIYFFRIPFNLNDPAVNKELLGEVEIEGDFYYKISISFDEEGGGDDFDDSFVYWINKKTYYIDYFAYSYSTDGGGKRFRKTINPRYVNGLRVVDYINYEPLDLNVPIEDYDSYFFEGGLKELSRIENLNIKVAYQE